jgi:hypothetical protein
MLWIGTAVALVAGIVVLMMVILVKRPIGVDELGSVSHRWIIDHRGD